MAIKIAGVDVINDDRELVLAKLTDINETVNDTAVDVFIYDTSKDSDGGAWRHRTQHTSWYNESASSTRGSRAEFPAVAVIVAESNKVTIYDGDDPALPMWMVFNAGFKYTIHGSQPITSISMLNGELRVGEAGSGAGNLSEISFLADKSGMRVNSTVYYYIRSALSQRNTSVTTDGAITAGLVNRDVNDVAMTVLPDAPIDPATGLPVPTIAVATAGGVSVIKDDGTVVDLTTGGPYPICETVFMTKDHIYIGGFDTGGFGRRYYVSPYQTSDTQIVNSSAVPINGAYAYGSFSGSNLRYLGDKAQRGVDANNRLIGTLDGITHLSENPTTPSNSMVAYTTSDYNTGWMNGDIKGAFLSDTDDTDLVGSGELVTNSGFDSDISGWTDSSTSGGSISFNASGHLDINSDGVGVGHARQIVSTEIGKAYTVSYDVLAVVGTNVHFYVGTSLAGSQYYSDLSGVGSYTFSFVATTTTAYISIREFTSGTSTVDNISVKLADADRSVNNKGLIVNGTVTRSPVATGADLVAYSGFSAGNYLEQPYNSDLDFGTGDFCVMGWVKTTATGFQNLVNRRGTTDGLMVTISNNKLAFSVTFNNFTEAASTIPVSTWFHFVVARTSGTVALYVNGALSASASRTENVSSDAPSMFVGSQVNGDNPVDGSLALLRISATAPTADQIAKIYNDEKVLFQENAKATLTGSSDAVTALAHDPDTNLLHVGTSGGRSVFQGLRRVDETATAVTTAISAVDGLVVEQ